MTALQEALVARAAELEAKEASLSMVQNQVGGHTPSITLKGFLGGFWRVVGVGGAFKARRPAGACRRNGWGGHTLSITKSLGVRRLEQRVIRIMHAAAVLDRTMPCFSFAKATNKLTLGNAYAPNAICL